MSCLILQIPLGLVVDRFGKKNSLVFANVCMCIFMVILLFTNTYIQLLIAFFADAIGYVIKGICETNILYDSLPTGNKRGSLYSTIDGKGSSGYYIMDAVTSLITGFAFVVSPYLPIILCLIGNIIATVLSTRFRHTYIPDDDEEQTGVKEYFSELKDAIKFAITSKRLLCLLLFFGLISGINYNLTTFRGGILEQIQLPEQYFGIVYAMIQIAASISARMQNFIHKKFRNRTLTVIGTPMAIFPMLIGILATGKVGNIRTVMIICMFVTLGASKGAYHVLTQRYLNNFTNRKIRTKLATIRNTVYNIFSILVSLLGAWLLGITNASNSIIILGIIATILLLFLLYYMKDKVGLKPEEYSEKDLKYSHLLNMK